MAVSATRLERPTGSAAPTRKDGPGGADRDQVRSPKRSTRTMGTEVVCDVDLAEVSPTGRWHWCRPTHSSRQIQAGRHPGVARALAYAEAQGPAGARFPPPRPPPVLTSPLRRPRGPARSPIWRGLGAPHVNHRRRHGRHADDARTMVPAARCPTRRTGSPRPDGTDTRSGLDSAPRTGGAGVSSPRSAAPPPVLPRPPAPDGRARPRTCPCRRGLAVSARRWSRPSPRPVAACFAASRRQPPSAPARPATAPARRRGARAPRPDRP